MKKSELQQIIKEELIKVIKESSEKADKDYDGDGKIESPEAEFKGSKDKAIKKAMKNEASTKKIKGSLTKHFNYHDSGVKSAVRKLENELTYYAQDPNGFLDLNKIADLIADIIDATEEDVRTNSRYERDEF